MNKKQTLIQLILLALFLAVCIVLAVTGNERNINYAIVVPAILISAIWGLYLVIKVIILDISEGFDSGVREGHNRILLLLNIGVGGVVGLSTNLIAGLLVSIILFILYWSLIGLVRLVKRIIK